MTIAAVSTASSAPIDWPMKSGNPGVSIMCTRVSCVSRCSTEDRSECCQVFSSGSKSLTVVPRSTLPADWIAPALSSSASASVVLPDAPCPTSASVRMLVGGEFRHECRLLLGTCGMAVLVAVTAILPCSAGTAPAAAPRRIPIYAGRRPRSKRRAQRCKQRRRIIDAPSLDPAESDQAACTASSSRRLRSSSSSW